MKPLHKIKEKISDLIQKEMDLTNAEIADLQQKQQSNMSVYGIGGFYKRYENAIKRRYNHLEELEALQKVQGRAIILEPLRMYGYCCPGCNEKIYLTSQSPDTLDCPLCGRRIYKDGVYTEWNIQKGSRYTRLHH